MRNGCQADCGGSVTEAHAADVQASMSWRKFSDSDADIKPLQDLVSHVETKSPFWMMNGVTAEQAGQELKDIFTKWPKVTGDTPHPNREQLLSLARSDIGKPTAARVALCPKGPHRTANREDASDSLLVEAMWRIHMSFSKATNKEPGDIFFLDFKPYCLYYKPGERPSRKQRDREVDPAHRMYTCNALYVRFTLAVLNLVRRVKYLTAIGNVAQTALFNITFVKWLRQTETQAGRNARSAAGTIDPPAGRPEALLSTPGSLLPHAATLSHKASSVAFIARKRLQELVLNFDYYWIMAIVHEQRALNVVDAGAEVLMQSVFHSLREISRAELIQTPASAPTQAQARDTLRDLMWNHPVSFEDAVHMRWPASEYARMVASSVSKTAVRFCHRKPRPQPRKSREEIQRALDEHAPTLAEWAKPVAAWTRKQNFPLRRSSQRHRRDVKQGRLQPGTDQHYRVSPARRVLCGNIVGDNTKKQLLRDADDLREAIKLLRHRSWPIQKLYARAERERHKLLSGDDWLRLERIRHGLGKDHKTALAVLTFRQADDRNPPRETQSRVEGMRHAVCILQLTNKDANQTLEVARLWLLYLRDGATRLDCSGDIRNAAKHTFEFLEAGAIFVTSHVAGEFPKVGIVWSKVALASVREQSGKLPGRSNAAAMRFDDPEWLEFKYTVHTATRSAKMSLGLPTLPRVAPGSAVHKSLKFWCSMPRKCQTIRSVTLEEAEEDTQFRALLFPSGITLHQDEATRQLELWLDGVQLGSQPLSTLRIRLPVSETKHGVEGFIQSSLVQKRSVHSKSLELFWDKDNQILTSPEDVPGDADAGCSLRPIGWGCDPPKTRRQSTRPTLASRVWSRIPYRHRPADVHGDAHLREHHQPVLLSVTTHNRFSPLVTVSDVVDPEQQAEPGPMTDKERRVCRQLRQRARHCYANCDGIFGGIRAQLIMNPVHQQSLLKAMYRLTKMNDVACLAFLTVERVCEIVASKVSALATAQSACAIADEMRTTRGLLEKVSDDHAGRSPDLDAQLSERLSAALRVRDDWLADADLLLQILRGRSPPATAAAAAEYVRAGLSTGKNTKPLVLACLLVALRASQVSRDQANIIWKEPYSMWTESVLVMNLTQFEALCASEDFNHEPLTAALFVKLPKGDVVLLPRANVKPESAKGTKKQANPRTKTKANSRTQAGLPSRLVRVRFTNLWSMLYAFVRTVPRLTQAEQMGTLPAAVAGVLETCKPRKTNTPPPSTAKKKPRCQGITKASIKQCFGKAANELTKSQTQPETAPQTTGNDEFWVSIGHGEDLHSKSSKICAELVGLALSGPQPGTQNFRLPIPVRIHLGDQTDEFILGDNADEHDRMSTSTDHSFSTDELLCLRAVASLSDDRILTGRFHTQASAPRERAQGSMQTMSLLHQQHFDWYWRPAQVAESTHEAQTKLDGCEDDGDDTDALTERVKDVILSLQKILMPATVALNPAHRKSEIRVAAQGQREKSKPPNTKLNWSKVPEQIWAAFESVFVNQSINRTQNQASVGPGINALIKSNRVTIGEFFRRDMDDPVAYVTAIFNGESGRDPPKSLLGRSEAKAWYRKVRGALKSHRTRVSHHQKSSAFSSARFETKVSSENGAPSRYLPKYNLIQFTNGPIPSQRCPLKLEPDHVQLETAAGDLVVHEGRASQKRGKKQAEKSTTSLAQLAKTNAKIVVVKLQVNWPCRGKQTYQCKATSRGGTYLNLRPAETGSTIAREWRDDLTTKCNIMGGECTYDPSTKMTAHLPIKATEVLRVHPSSSVSSAKSAGDSNGCSDDEEVKKYQVMFQKVQSIVTKREQTTSRHTRRYLDQLIKRLRGQLFRQRKRMIRSIRIEARAREQASNTPPPKARRRYTWEEGVKFLPPSLERYNPGSDHTGTPLVYFSIPPGIKESNLWRKYAQEGKSLDGLNWSFGADPNITSFYDMYLPSGITVHVGDGWAQRILSTYGRAIDDHQSEMDQLVNQKMQNGKFETLDQVKALRAATLQSLQASNSEYQQHRNEIAKLRTKIQAAQSRLHKATCTIMAAFHVRILPWFESDRLLRRTGSGDLSKANKRKLNFLAHGKFRQRLIQVCGDPTSSNRCIVWVTEEYSSKLCSHCHVYCGYLRGGTFKCPNEACGRHMHRDGNAAKNIWSWGIMEAIQDMVG
jgi:hypothetical protein